MDLIPHHLVVSGEPGPRVIVHPSVGYAPRQAITTLDFLPESLVNVGDLDCERIDEYERYREENAFSEGAFEGAGFAEGGQKEPYAGGPVLREPVVVFYRRPAAPPCTPKPEPYGTGGLAKVAK